MQKLSVNVGFSCPNRDGTLGRGGCTYCNNSAFVPSYCDSDDDVTTQLEKGKAFFGRKYPDMRYMAYFQAYTSTYSTSSARLTDLYLEALNVEKIEAVVISTRPDCVGRELLEALDHIRLETGKKIFFEIGVETSCDTTLTLVNRHHTWAQTVEAINKIADCGFEVGAHLIMGLPGESNSRMLQSIGQVCSLPVSSLKLHQLQIIKGTPLYDRWKLNPSTITLFALNDYIEFCIQAIKIVPSHIAIERFTASAPAELLAAPKWGIKNYEFVNLLNNRLKKA